MRDFHHPGRSPVYSDHGMAATSMPAATLTALDVLRAGGNALDAAIAAVAVLCVIEQHSTGIGGDCFCLYAPAGTGRVIAMNGSGRAPAAASLDRLLDAGVTTIDPWSAHAVTIPGAISAWNALLTAHGTKGLDELLRPAIGFAEDGYRVHNRVAYDWGRAEEKLRRNNTLRFLPRDGHAPAVGDRFALPELAETLRAIGRNGPSAFYRGRIAASMVAALRSRGGLHTEEDFAAGETAAMFVEPISTRWRGLDIFECPPNGSGIHVLMMLGVLGGMENPAADGPLGALRLHRHIESARLVYRDRDAFLADPAQVDVPVAHLLSAEYLDGLRALISDERAMTTLPPPGETAYSRHDDTVYLCVVDRDGNACSFINSLFQGFGSGILADEAGVMLQNRGFGFTMERGHPNCIAPNKRPLHTIIPAMVMKDGEAVMPFGVMGGHFQPMGQSWFLSNMVDHGLDIQAALDVPRIFPYRGVVDLERGVPAEAADQLARMGHTVRTAELPHGGGQAIWIDRARGCLIGGSDPRKDGLALGY